MKTVSTNDSVMALNEQVLESLEELKARDIVSLDVSELTPVMERLIVATGTSRRHVKALAGNVVDKLRDAGQRPIGVEGDDITGWILIDFGDVVVHVMSEESRTFYDLEKLWTMRPPTDA